MQRTLPDILSRALSVLFYPLFVPTYGMALFLYGLNRQTVVPILTRYWVVSLVGTFFFTCFVPMSLIVYMLMKKQVKSLDLSDRKERTTPYIYAIGGFAFWAYFTYSVLRAPMCMVWTAVGATGVLIAVAITNRWWKISAHSAGIGGLIGGLASYCLFYSLLPTGLILGFFVLSLLILCARVQANAHTPQQVVAGYLLGIAGTFLPNLIYIGYA